MRHTFLRRKQINDDVLCRTNLQKHETILIYQPRHICPDNFCPSQRRLPYFPCSKSTVIHDLEEAWGKIIREDAQIHPGELVRMIPIAGSLRRRRPSRELYI